MLHTTAPASVVQCDPSTWNAGGRYEDDRLLAQSQHEWQVLKVLTGGSQCSPTHHVLEFVRLKRVNYGIRWRNVRNADAVPPRCMMGPHWYLMVATWSCFSVLVVTVNVVTIGKAGMVERGAGVLLSGMCLTCYALVGCTNPGIVQRTDVPLDDTFTYCDHCESYRPEGAMHCMDCRVCIEEYDHHCPWTGKCIGKRNVRYFYAWLFFLVLAFVYEMIEFTTYFLPPDDRNVLDSLDDSLEIGASVVTPAPLA
ncbi:unnamed protein product [Hyaloperonospora brassicae]|uniref:Palmitoyltransferase n=1 Tax=Hyaloperonospora brassicae TaxID=162125 RepID=A0AAV0TS94_HYABA|nr:unnamed protein product [Hyaloperonospora brassicae]